jgi:hypothetical protein
MVTAIVLAAGRSTRMGGGLNKQFIELLGKPLMWYSLTAFELCGAVDAVMSRAPSRLRRRGRTDRPRVWLHKVAAFADGGVERQNSVWNGLEKCDPATEIVAVHDGARPLVTSALIESTIASARSFGHRHCRHQGCGYHQGGQRRQDRCPYGGSHEDCGPSRRRRRSVARCLRKLTRKYLGWRKRGDGRSSGCRITGQESSSG